MGVGPGASALTRTGAVPVQKNILGNFGLGPGASIQLEFQGQDGQPVPTAKVKVKGNETETLPLYSNKSTVKGEVRVVPVGPVLSMA